MANEITVNVSLACSNGNFLYNRNTVVQVDQTTVGGGNPGTVSVATSNAAISGLSGLTNEGFTYLRNLDDTNYLEVGVEVSSTFYPLVKLNPGEVALMRLSPGVSVHAQADTAACLLQMEVLED